jgi:hypothetical protein
MESVRQRNLTTYTSEYCLSAATLVLMAGKERVIAANAKVGFHAGSFPGLTPEQHREMDLFIRSTMQSAGVGEQFINRVLATPSDQMWYPAFEEMKMAGVVTSQSFGERFAVSWAQSDEEIDEAVKKIGNLPWFSTIRELEPKLYAKMIDDFTTAIKAGKSEGEATSLVRANALGLMEKYFPAASDEALLGLLRDEWIPILTKYGGSNSRACIAVLSGREDSTINFSRAFPDWDMSTTLALADAILRSGASKIPVRANKVAARSDLERIFKSLAARYGNDVQLLDQESQWMNNSQEVCEMLLAMYRQISALPNKRAANVVRYLVTAKDQLSPQPGRSVVQPAFTPPPDSVTAQPVMPATPVGEKQKITRGQKNWAEDRTQQPQIFDKRVVPGTRWIASVTMERGEYVSCQIELNVQDGVQVRYTIGSNGSPVILLNDKYMARQVSETLGWTQGQSYRAQLFLDDKQFNVQTGRIGQHTLLIPLVSIDPETAFRTKKMALQVAGIAMRGYDVKGLDIASHELLDCYRQHGTNR